MGTYFFLSFKCVCIDTLCVIEVHIVVHVWTYTEILYKFSFTTARFVNFFKSNKQDLEM